MSENNTPDLDLIQMVQQARMVHDDQTRPSEVAAVYWIEAKRTQGDYPPPTPQTGYWRIETDLEHVDALWEIIKKATADGKLGYKSKVSTASAKGQRDASDRIIYVCTYDSRDQVDVERTRQVLVELGISSDIVYISD